MVIFIKSILLSLWQGLQVGLEVGAAIIVVGTIMLCGLTVFSSVVKKKPTVGDITKTKGKKI